MRTDEGYAPIEQYAAIGDGRTVALMASDGSVDWLCLPDLDSPSALAALLDPDRGGRFVLAPDVPFEASRRYVPDTNVLQTTYRTGEGCVRVTDALTLPLAGPSPLREMARRVEGLAGRVPMRWCLEPRLHYAEWSARRGRRGPWWVADARGRALAVRGWETGEARWQGDALEGRFEVADGERALLALAYADRDPLVLSCRDDVERRLDATVKFWCEWTGRSGYDGPWTEAVHRSALALKLLVHAPTGAIAAAPTSSLPEDIGGCRNWDYRYSWIRDCAFTLDALLALGHDDEADAFFSWLMHASQQSHPRLRPLYRLDGREPEDERELDLRGYRCSKPVYAGNGAAEQLQLGIYGTVLDTVAIHVERGGEVERDTAGRVADLADTVCDLWCEPDAGIWEVRSDPRHFTHSKIMCWVALDRALRLAQDHLPGVHAARWRRERERIEHFVEERCWSDEHGSYMRHAGSDGHDGALMVAGFVGYPNRERVNRTVDATRRALAEGPVLRRYRGDDGLPGEEGAFLTCSFWLVQALAELGRVDEAAETMESLLELANDVGLYSEEIDADSGTFLGNFPQGLTHLALVNAATSVAEASE